MMTARALIPTKRERGLPRGEKKRRILNKDHISGKDHLPLSENTTGSSGVAPRFHDQIEAFLQTTLEGLSRESRPTEPASAGRPQHLPSSSLWMAV